MAAALMWEKQQGGTYVSVRAMAATALLADKVALRKPRIFSPLTLFVAAPL